MSKDNKRTFHFVGRVGKTEVEATIHAQNKFMAMRQFSKMHNREVKDYDELTAWCEDETFAFLTYPGSKSSQKPRIKLKTPPVTVVSAPAPVLDKDKLPPTPPPVTNANAVITTAMFTIREA